jgi:hypothetical protein
MKPVADSITDAFDDQGVSIFLLKNVPEMNGAEKTSVGNIRLETEYPRSRNKDFRKSNVKDNGLLSLHLVTPMTFVCRYVWRNCGS